MLTDKEKFHNLKKKLTSLGVYVRRNVGGCCRGCAAFSTPEQEATNFWNYAGQGNPLKFDNGRAHGEFYFNHSGLADGDELTSTGLAVLKSLAGSGIAFEWDCTESQCILLRFS